MVTRTGFGTFLLYPRRVFGVSTGGGAWRRGLESTSNLFLAVPAGDINLFFDLSTFHYEYLDHGDINCSQNISINVLFCLLFFSLL